MVYDYRPETKEIMDMFKEIDTLTERQLLKVAETVGDVKRLDEQEYITRTKNYFDNAVLPLLQDFGKITGSLLVVDENEQTQTVKATFKNEYGFDVTESCKCMRSLLFIANHISINLDDNDEIVISLDFDYKKMN